MSGPIRVPLFPILMTALLAPTAVNAELNATLDNWPEWVQASMADELGKTKLRRVKMPIKTLSVKMPGKPEPAQAIEDGWYFVSDIKAGSPLECYIYTTAMDLASLTSLLAENNIAAVAQGVGGTTGVRNVHYIDAGEVVGLPYLALEWIYTVTTDTQTLVGFTKVRAAVKGDIAFACTHNYLGYRQTFAKAFADFVENAEYEASAPVPYYEEIARLDFNQIGAGTAYLSFTEVEDGNIKMYTAQASIVPVDAATVTVSDSIRITYTKPNGELINSIDVDVENGEISSNVTLQRNDDYDWVSSGTLQGKEISTVLDGSVSPASELRGIMAAHDLFAGDESSVTLNIWEPSADPTRFLQTTYTKDDAETERQAKISLGPLHYVGQFDEFGNIASAVMPMGPMSIIIKRIWSTGIPVR
jgi:hypothetical protein